MASKNPTCTSGVTGNWSDVNNTMSQLTETETTASNQRTTYE